MSVRSTFRRLLEGLGLGGWAQRMVEAITYRRYRAAYQRDNRRVADTYAHLSEFRAPVLGQEVAFTTEDAYSKRWFYPRYLGGRIHEESVTRRLLEAIGDGPFADVGANLGWYCCVVARHRPDCRAHAFEMDELNFEILQQNLRLNDAARVVPHHVAVSDSTGTLHYHRRTKDPSAAYRLSPEGQQNRGEKVSVEAITLDEFYASEPELPAVMKIDVEGAEMGVLRGMKGMLGQGKPAQLFLEVHPQFLPEFGHSTADVLGMLEGFGYSLFEIEDFREDGADTLRPLTAESPIAPDTMIYARHG